MPDAGDLKNKLNKIVEEISSETNRIISSKISTLQKSIEDVVKSSHVVSVPTESQLDLKSLKDTSYSLQNAQGQNEIIAAILNFAGKCVQRAAVFAFKNKKLYGWQAVGLKADDPSQIISIKKMVIDATQPSPFFDVLKKRTPWIGKTLSNPILDDVFTKFGGATPKEICIFPLCIKDRVIAVLYGDNITSSQLLFQTDSLEIMSVISSLVMENISLLRSKGPAEAPKPEPEEKATRPTRVSVSEIPEGLDEETRKLHEKAKRTARVIVGDIALYNKAKIEQGLAKGNLGNLLKEDINKGRELYHQRVSTEITKKSNYFEETLIDMIAKGDRRSLGL